MIKRNSLGKRYKKSRIVGTTNCPRLYVFCTNNHIYAQIIDDTVGHTLLTVSTLDNSIKQLIKYSATCKSAQMVGDLVAQKALRCKIKSVVFDRGCHLYHGKVKALADSARERGLTF
nr:ribosomal protein L18 [Cavernulicola chilensis]